ncbi:hypothetical protein F5B18DRAFT_224686 [Nemania serpens]|nr:hypothetical protein F5B18DRAFT_224686 [Nemania serpens]
MRTRSSKRQHQGQVADRKNTALSPALPLVPSDSVASPTMENSDNIETTTKQRQRDIVGTPVEADPLDGPEIAHQESQDQFFSELPAGGDLASQLDEDNMNTLHVKLADQIRFMAEQCFRPTEWDRVNPDDQARLNCWTPNAKLLIESKRGYSPIFQAWIWHIIDDGVFSADPKTKWQGCSDRYEATKLFSQFLAIVQKPKDANGDDGYFTTLSKMKGQTQWYTSEYNKWRSVSAELALKTSGHFGSIHPDYAGKLIKDHLGYLMIERPPNHDQITYEGRIGGIVSRYDACLLICRVNARLVWTDPLQPYRQGTLHGFPFTIKIDPKKEQVVGLNAENGTALDVRMEVEEPKGAIEEDLVRLRAVSDGQHVQLVVSPGLVTRGWTTLENHKPFVTDWHLLSWRHPLTTVVPCTFEPPIKPATSEIGMFKPAR